MYTNYLKVISTTILLSVITGCATVQQNQLYSENNLINDDKTLVASNQSEQNKPLHKTVTIFVEGEKTTVDLKLYQAPNLFSIYFPEKEFLVKATTSGKPKIVKFIANFGGVKNENAYIQITFPDKFKTIGELKKFINSKNGIIATNKWKVTSRSSTLIYPWMKEKISFSKGKDMIGNIYIGEQKGKVFYVITHFPVEYGDGFAPRGDLILKNLEISS